MQFAKRFDILKRLTAGEKKQNQNVIICLLSRLLIKIYILFFFSSLKKMALKKLFFFSSSSSFPHRSIMQQSCWRVGNDSRSAWDVGPHGESKYFFLIF